MGFFLDLPIVCFNAGGCSLGKRLYGTSHLCFSASVMWILNRSCVSYLQKIHPQTSNGYTERATFSTMKTHNMEIITRISKSYSFFIDYILDKELQVWDIRTIDFVALLDLEVTHKSTIRGLFN